MIVFAMCPSFTKLSLKYKGVFCLRRNTLINGYVPSQKALQMTYNAYVGGAGAVYTLNKLLLKDLKPTAHTISPQVRDLCRPPHVTPLSSYPQVRSQADNTHSLN